VQVATTQLKLLAQVASGRVGVLAGNKEEACDRIAVLVTAAARPVF